jgi:hypothetical protein
MLKNTVVSIECLSNFIAEKSGHHQHPNTLWHSCRTSACPAASWHGLHQGFQVVTVIRLEGPQPESLLS